MDKALVNKLLDWLMRGLWLAYRWASPHIGATQYRGILMKECLCRDLRSAVLAAEVMLARTATPTSRDEVPILVIEATGQKELPFRVWTGTLTVSNGRGEIA